LREFPRLLCFLPVISLASGCDPSMFSAQVEAPEICVTGLAFSVPAAAGEAVADQPLSLADLGLELLGEVAGEPALEVEVLGVGLVPGAGVTNLQFLDALRVRAVATEDLALPPLDVVEMNRGDHMSNGAIYAEPEHRVDLARHLRAGGLALAIELEGELPQVAWGSTLELCVQVVASY
jgi:hypothetical protein